MSKLFSKEPITVSSFSEVLEKSVNYDENQKYEFICPICKKNTTKRQESILNNKELLCWGCNNKKSLKNKYGVENISQLSDIKEKKKQTTFNHFGTEYPTQNKEVMAKIQQTNISKYGGKSPNCDKEIKSKTKNTNFKKYGNFCPANKDISINEKSRKTMIEKYGTISVKRNFIYNEIYFDSSWELYFYVYMKEIKYLDVKRNPKYINYSFNNKTYKYFPDFEINGELFEIKGDHLFEKMKIENTKENAKLKCMEENNIKILCYDDLQYIFKTIDEVYGKDFINSCKN